MTHEAANWDLEKSGLGYRPGRPGGPGKCGPGPRAGHRPARERNQGAAAKPGTVAETKRATDADDAAERRYPTACGLAGPDGRRRGQTAWLPRRGPVHRPGLPGGDRCQEES